MRAWHGCGCGCVQANNVYGFKIIQVTLWQIVKGGERCVVKERKWG